MIASERRSNSRIQLIFFATAFLSFTILVLALPRISIPLSLAYVLSLTLTPIVNYLMGLGISRTLSIVVLFLALAILVVFPLVKIIPVVSIESQYVQNSIPRIEQYFYNEYGMFRDYVKLKTGHQIDDTYILQFLNEAKSAAENIAIHIPNYLANLMEWIFLVPFFTFFIIRDSVSFKKTLLSFTPNIIFERFYYVTHVFNRQLGNYFFAKFVEAIIVGGIITIGLLVMKVKYAVILGFIAGLTNIVPYVGPFLGIIPAFVLAMVEYGITSSTIGGILVLYAIANVVDVFFVFPFLVSKIVNLHPMIVAISVIAGSHYMGITGMVISIPVVAAIKLIITEIYNEIYTERSR